MTAILLNKTKKLSLIYSQLATEWHPTKNGDLTLDDLTSSSNKKVWWQCSTSPNHEWQATVANRSKVKGSKCPYCSNRKTNHENCLQTTHPQLAAEWHSAKNEELKHPKTHEKLTTTTITAGSSCEVWWQCSSNTSHEWKAKICERRGNEKRKGTDCPHCYSQASDAEYRLAAELQFFFPNLKHKEKIAGKEADILIAELGEDSGLVIEIDGSYYHEGDKALKRDIKKTELFEQKNYTVLRLRGEKLPKISKHNIFFNCKKLEFEKVKEVLRWIDHKYDNTQSLTPKIKEKIQDYLNKTTFQNNKEYLKNRKTLPGKYTLGNFEEKSPDLAKEWHPTKNGNFQPEHFSLKSGKLVWWQCSKNPDHEWQTKIYSRANGQGCPYCVNKSVDINNCLATINPQLATEWHPIKNKGLTAEQVVSGSNKKVWWQCSKNPIHEWKSTIDSRHRAKIGCPYCSGKRVCNDNSLSTKNPQLATEWHPIKNEDLTPDDFTSGSKKNVWWQCSKNHDHEWNASIDSRNRGNGCPVCSGRKVHLSTSLAIINPQLAAEWHPTKNGNWTPNDFTRGSKKIKIWWLCSQGHEYQSLILTRSHGHGCPECAKKIKRETALKRWAKYRDGK